MSVIEDSRKILQDFIAPELRAISSRLDSLEKRLDGFDKRFEKIDGKFDDLDRKADRRHDEMMSAVAQMIEITMLRERVARLESGNRPHQ
jgi:tetrahydromethanopterin S-methyltransferase subunit G